MARKSDEASKVALPKTIGATIDKIYKTRGEKSALDAKSAEKARDGEALEAHALKLLGEEGLESGRGKLAQASRSSSDHPTIIDWASFEKYVVKTKSFDLLHRRVASGAWRERIEAGKKVPGIGTFTKISLHVTKVAR